MKKTPTDIEIALWLQRHIDNPCGDSCRDNYITLAKLAIEKFKNPFATKLLEQKVQQYSN